MDKQEIIEGNRLIAEFMGLKWLGETHISDKYTDMGVKDGPFEYEADYHSDWSSLMPVVEKIEWLDSDKIDSRITISRQECRVYFHSEIGNYEWTIDGFPKIESAWKSIVRFLKWYNSQKQ